MSDVPSPSSEEEFTEDAVSAEVPVPEVSPTNSFSEINNSMAQVQTDLSLISEAITSIDHTITQVQSDFSTKIMYDQSKEVMLNTLQQELQRYREDLAFKHLRPVMIDLIRIYDDIQRLVEPFMDGQPIDSENVPHLLNNLIGNVATLPGDIEEILNRNGFELYQVESATFDRSQQKLNQTHSTENAEFDRLIANRVRKGIRYGNIIVRPEIVNVYSFVAPSHQEQG